MTGTSPWPPGNNLFDEDEISPKLSEKQAEFFYQTTARLLFASKKGHPNLQAAVVYLYTKVKCPNESYLLKLSCVIRYLEGTMFTPLVIGWDNTEKNLWSIDVSFAVYKDMRSHTGAVMTLGEGDLLSFSL